MNRNPRYGMELVLSAFNRAEITDMDTGDGPERGIFIPFRFNNIYCSKTGYVKAYFSVIPKRPNLLGESHYIKGDWPKQKIEQMERYGLEPPRIGSLTPGFRKMSGGDVQSRSSIKDVLGKD